MKHNSFYLSVCLSVCLLCLYQVCVNILNCLAPLFVSFTNSKTNDVVVKTYFLSFNQNKLLEFDIFNWLEFNFFVLF